MSTPLSNFHTHPLPLGHCRAQQSDLYNTTTITTTTTTTTKTPFVVAKPIVDEKTEEEQEKWMCGDDEVARWKVDVDGKEEEDGVERRERVDIGKK
jgi:hypothetical protein